MNFLENITFRRNRSKSETNIDENDITISTNSPIDGTTTSLPDISDDEEDQITKLKLQVEQLTLDLNAAHGEIESLTLENSNLNRLNQELQKQNSLFKKVACSPAKLKPQIPKSQKKSAKQVTKKNTEKFSERKGFTTGVEQCVSQSCVKNLQQLDKSDTDGATHTPTPKYNGTKTEYQETELSTKRTKTRKSKLCILSCNKNNKILEIAEDKLWNYEICHYLTPNTGINNLLLNLDLKLKDYTSNDYCVIFIGEEDFRQTSNYVELTINIREMLLKLQHTNIILCAPTFKLNQYSAMFNSRIETFNSLMYLDACTYNFAYLFDSNFYLDYDISMFRKNSGSVNNRGMANIIHNLSLMINEFTPYDNSVSCDSFDEVSDLPHSVPCKVSDENELFFL